MITALPFIFIHLAIAAGPSGGASDHDALRPPVCIHASHDRLTVRRGRDVCSPSRDAEGREQAVGLMPTACPDDTDRMHIDARQQVDVCKRRKTAPDREGTPKHETP